MAPKVEGVAFGLSVLCKNRLYAKEQRAEDDGCQGDRYVLMHHDLPRILSFSLFVSKVSAP